jgi:hypothetical protein
MRCIIFYLYYSFFENFKKKYNSESFATHILASGGFALPLAFITSAFSNIIYYFFSFEIIDTDGFVPKMLLIYLSWLFIIYFYAGHKNNYLKFLEENCPQRLVMEKKLNFGIIFVIFSIILFMISGYIAYWPRK